MVSSGSWACRVGIWATDKSQLLAVAGSGDKPDAGWKPCGDPSITPARGAGITCG